MVWTGRQRIIYALRGSFDPCHLEYEFLGLIEEIFSDFIHLADLRFPLTAA